MAVRFDASGEDLSRTTNLPTITGFTIMGWFKISTDRNTTTAFIAFGDSGSDDYYHLGTEGDGTTLGTWNGSTFPGGSALTVGTWYHLTMVVSGTGAGQFLIYLNGVLDITSDGNSGVTAEKLFIGNNRYDEYQNGVAAHLKMWSAALTAAEILQEMHTIRPLRLANLNGWYPTWPGTTERARDYSGNGYAFTETGTLADEAGPPVSWGTGVMVAQVPAAATASAIAAIQHSYRQRRVA